MKGLHILVVDDNETNREILLGQLGSWGCRVKEAADGPDALYEFYQASSAKDPFQIAILDMQMPGMDGLSLGRTIKADDKLKSVHLIMMTSMGQAGDAKRFKKIGFTAYLIKPVGHSDLFDCMSTIITGGSKPQIESTIITRHTVRELQRNKIRILLAAGMDGYVAKPIDAKALLEALERWLPKNRTGASPPALEPDKIVDLKTTADNNLMVFDKDGLMDRLMDDMDLYETVISDFLDDMPKQMDVLKKLIDQKNIEDAGKKGHLIKGAASNIGADVFSSIASKIEEAGKSGDSDRLRFLVPQLEDAFDQLKKTMEKIIL